MHGAPWSDDDKATLIRLRQEKRKPFVAIATAMGRTERSVANMYNKLVRAGEAKIYQPPELTKVPSRTLAEVLRGRGWTCKPPPLSSSIAIGKPPPHAVCNRPGPGDTCDGESVAGVGGVHLW